MAGTWKAQNKRRPGAYINVKGNRVPLDDSTIGRLLMVSNIELGWGKPGVIPVSNLTDFRAELGYKIDDPKLVPLKQALKGAETVLLVNINEGTKATGTAETSPWEFTAKYPGIKGNDIKVSIESMPVTKGDPTRATVTTLYGSSIVDQEVIAANRLSDLEGNAYVDVKLNEAVTKLPSAPVTINLTGGATKTLAVEDLMDKALENENYAVATTAGMPTDSNIHSLLVEAMKRLRESEGRKVRAVIPVDATAPVYNYEGVSMVANGFVEGDGTKVSTTDAAAFFAGISASADAGTALTYYDVSDAIEANPKLSNEQTIDALNRGEIVFTTRPGQHVVVEQDINSLVKFTSDKPKSFSKNRVIRTLDEICTNTTQTFEGSFLGKVGNNANGRDLFKANRVSYLRNLQSQNIIQNFDEDDLKVSPGIDGDAIVVDLAVTPVDAMEKLYMTITVD